MSGWGDDPTMVDPRLGGRPERTPAVAGAFYPGDRQTLEAMVDRLLGTAALPDGPRTTLADAPIRGALVPHAGLVYSGGIAALAWRLLAERAAAGPVPPTVLIAGTNHFSPFVGVSVWGGGPWRTPLGDVAIADAWRDALAGLGAPFAPDVRGHLREHSIEVQLPLLARSRPDARVVPFLVSIPDPAECLAAGARLGRLIAERSAELGPAVLVASSDLVHYPDDTLAREVDERVLEPILALDGPELAGRELAIRDAGLPGVACGLCGFEPTLLTIAAVRELGATRGVLLGHATSADAPRGDPTRVVGYAAVAFI